MTDIETVARLLAKHQYAPQHWSAPWFKKRIDSEWGEFVEEARAAIRATLEIVGCMKTGNPPGTDTIASGYSCTCRVCQLIKGLENTAA